MTDIGLVALACGLIIGIGALISRHLLLERAAAHRVGESRSNLRAGLHGVRNDRSLERRGVGGKTARSKQSGGDARSTDRTIHLF